MSDPGRDSASERKIAKVHDAYLRANTIVSGELLRKVWDPDPSNVWFNLTGHKYQGLEHWIKLWEYYAPRRRARAPWTAFATEVTVHGGVGWLTCSRFADIEWTGEETRPNAMNEIRSRSTMIFLRRSGRWMAVHAHFSEESQAPRPGDEPE